MILPAATKRTASAPNVGAGPEVGVGVCVGVPIGFAVGLIDVFVGVRVGVDAGIFVGVSVGVRVGVAAGPVPPEMSVKSEAVSFAGLRSPAVETMALLLTDDAAVVLTLTVRVILLAGDVGVSGPGFVQVTLCLTAEQLQPVPVAETKLRPAGNVSVTVITPVVRPAPTFETSNMYTPVLPALKAPA